MREYSTLECREIRKRFTGNVAKRLYWLELEPGVRALAWKNVLHRSTEIYLVRIEGEAAYHAMITKSCAWKRIGLARPTESQLVAWNES